MPFVPSTETQFLPEKMLTEPEEQVLQEEPTMGEVAGALLRTENIIGSWWTQPVGLPDTKDDPTFDAYEMLTEDERNDEQFVKSAVFADNDSELEVLRTQFARERKDRETIAKGGATSFALALPIAVADPISLMTIGGAVANTYRAGKSILSSGLVTGSLVTAETALQESMLHSTQLTRTYGESAVNMGAAFLLGSTLGMGVQKLANYGLDEEATKAFADAMDPEAKIARGQNPALSDENVAQGFDSVGAARTVEGTFEVKGKVAKALTKYFGFSPLTRTMTSDSLVTRRIANMLAENPVDVDGAPLQSVESLAKIKGGRLAYAIDNNTRLFSEYRKSGGKMKRREFNEAVARAVRTGDSEIPQIKQSADYWRNELYNPLRDEMVALKMLPEDVDVTTSVNYLNRVYNTQKIRANMPSFVSKVSKWLKDKDESLYQEAKDAADELGEDVALPEGKPITAFHRTTAEPFFEFKKGDKSAHSYAGSEGIYFSRQSDDPRTIAFGANQVEASVYINNPAPVQTVTSSFDGRDFTFVRIDIDEVPADLDSIRTIKDGDIATVKDLSKKELNKLVKSKNLFRMIDPERLFPEDVAAMKKAGFDGIEVPKGKDKPPQVVALDPSQIRVKSFREGGKVIDAPKPETKQLSKAEKARLQAIIDKAEFKKGKDFEPEDYENIARQIAQRITGTPDGRLPYDWKMGDGFNTGSKNSSLGGTALRGPLRNRRFLIEDEIIEEFLENDIEVLGMRYLQQTAADIELTRKFQGVDLEPEIKQIAEDYDRMAADVDKRTDLTDAQKEKLRIKLGNQKDADIRDIAGMRDRLRGVYGFQEDNIWTRIGRSSRDLNYLRLLGGVTVSSLPDAARIIMAEGFAKTFANGLGPLIANTKQFKIAAAEAKRYGVATDAMGPGGRSSIIADVGDYTQGGTMLERGLRSGANKFGRVNFLDYWTSGMKQLHAVTMQTSIFDGLSKGKYDKRLGRLGIDEESARRMWKQVDKHGSKEDGVWILNAKNWDDPELEQMWGAALRKESDRVIVVPGQEKPLFMSTEMGKSIGQFRSFIMSATTRVLVAGIQGQDQNAIGGFISLVGMGVFTYYLKQTIAGREITDDPVALVIEGIDRSGAVGILGEINNTLEKISSNSVGLRPLTGVSAPASRFYSRSVSESLLGPTFGSLLSTTVAASNALTSSEPMTEADVRALRRLVPLQNLSILRGIERLAE